MPGRSLPVTSVPDKDVWHDAGGSMTTTTLSEPSMAEPGGDPLALDAVDAVEFWVGNAMQAAHFYRTGWGFELVAYAGPETGVRDRCSYVLEQGALRIVLTA